MSPKGYPGGLEQEVGCMSPHWHKHHHGVCLANFQLFEATLVECLERHMLDRIITANISLMCS